MGGQILHLIRVGVHTTHLGRFTVHWQVVVNLVSLEGTGSARVLAANRDELRSTVAGLAPPTATPDVFRIVEEHTITGGIGRFKGAGGTFRAERWVNAATGATSASSSGTLVRKLPE